MYFFVTGSYAPISTVSKLKTSWIAESAKYFKQNSWLFFCPQKKNGLPAPKV